MSDFDRNAVAGRFGKTVGRDDAAVIDQGLRAYMLHIYNYMVLGLAITGFAALGVYMLSITGDASAAAKVMRSGAEVPAQIRGGTVSHAASVTRLFVSPLKWAVMLAPLALVLVLSFGIERMRPATAQILFWIFAALMGISLGSIFMIYTHTSITRVFFITAASFGALQPVRLHHAARPLGHGLVPDHGPVRRHHREPGQSLARKLDAAIHRVGRRRARLRRPHRLRHAAAEERIRLRRADGETMERSAIMGALSLYLNFINLFTLLAAAPRHARGISAQHRNVKRPRPIAGAFFMGFPPAIRPALPFGKPALAKRPGNH